MHPDTRHVAQHVKEFGLAVLGRAAYDMTFSEQTRPWAHAMAIGHAAHGAELVVKARIAQEHPLLLFSTLPKSANATAELTITDLFDYGRTVQFNELPELLWATTGYRMDRVDQFQRFGKLRNSIIHFAVPPYDAWQDDIWKFLFEIMEPLVQAFWTESILPHATVWDEVTVAEGYLEQRLDRHGVTITPALQAAIDAEKH